MLPDAATPRLRQHLHQQEAASTSSQRTSAHAGAGRTLRSRRDRTFERRSGGGERIHLGAGTPALAARGAGAGVGCRASACPRGSQAALGESRSGRLRDSSLWGVGRQQGRKRGSSVITLASQKSSDRWAGLLDFTSFFGEQSGSGNSATAPSGAAEQKVFKAAELAQPTLQAAPRIVPSRIPIYVMLPLNTVTREGVLQNVKALGVGFQALKQIGVDGVMVDVWWGVVERIGPKEYDWSAYKQLLGMVKAAGLKLQCTMSFHACGANVGDVYEIPLPSWVLESALQDPDMLFTDQHGYRNPECLSLFADNAATVASRTPLQCYQDLMMSFAQNFKDDLGKTLVEVGIGCGPCGELRYPAYPENKRCPKASQWRFPGIGEFQCYDKRALLSLAKAASEAGHIEWGGAGPHDAGGYNDLPHETGFFKSNDGSWDSAYGQFFLSWYSGQLVEHGDRMLQTASVVFKGRGVQLSLKCAGVHWWYNSRSHAAELTAGYYNTRQGDRVPEGTGYGPVLKLCSTYGAQLNFTCVEMRDLEHPWEARCGPEGLLRQIRATAAQHNVSVVGENALCRFDRDAYSRIIDNCVGDTKWDASKQVAVVPAGGLPPMAGFTFLRMNKSLFDEHNFSSFVRFVRQIQEAMGSQPDPEQAPASPPALPDISEFVDEAQSVVCAYRL